MPTYALIHGVGRHGVHKLAQDDTRAHGLHNHGDLCIQVQRQKAATQSSGPVLLHDTWA